MLKKKIIVLIFFSFWISIVHAAVDVKVSSLNYIITETPSYTSLDPLDADQTQNLPVARMLYATPLETDSTDQLKSAVLESFSYDPQALKMRLILKAGLKYSDGEPITTKDLELAILRMANSRPSFPIIEQIKGLSEWHKSKTPLLSRPVGVHTTPTEVSIVFNQTVDQPLVRFSLELFSIIPEKCIDRKTGHLICQTIPSSGPYVIDHQEPGQISFTKRPFNSTIFDKVPEKINFVYMSTDDVAKKYSQIGNSSIVAGDASMFEGASYTELEKHGKTLRLPRARFTSLLINPTFGVFEDIGCRQVLAQKYHEVFQRENLDNFVVESSIFTKLLPGYLPYDKMLAALRLENVPETCKKMTKSTVTWGYVREDKDSIFNKNLRQALKELNIPTVEKSFANNDEFINEFVAGKIAFKFASSGFWAFDPAGDLKMFFTPNLHPTLKYLWSDLKFQALINKADATKNQVDFQNFNQYLFNEALLVVLAHSHRFYWSPNPELLKSAQFGTTAPAPWQVFADFKNH